MLEKAKAGLMHIEKLFNSSDIQGPLVFQYSYLPRPLKLLIALRKIVLNSLFRNIACVL